VSLPGFDAGRTARLESLIDGALGRSGSLFVAQPEEDVEVALLTSPRAYVVLAINWDSERQASVDVRLPLPDREREVAGRRVLPDGRVEAVRASLGSRFSVQLDPQEARLLAFRR